MQRSDDDRDGVHVAGRRLDDRVVDVVRPVRQHHFGVAGEQQLARTVRYELSPLTDGSYRRRDIRSALEESWASLTNADSLKVLAGLRCPILIVHAARPWPGNQPYLPDAVIQDQLQAAPHASCFEARSSTHPMLVRDPEPKLVEAIQTFVRTHADTTAARVGPAA